MWFIVFWFIQGNNTEFYQILNMPNREICFEMQIQLNNQIQQQNIPVIAQCVNISPPIGS